MPTPRKQLAQGLIANRVLNSPLSDETRSAIISAILNGQAPGQVAARFECHRNTVTNIVRKWKRTHQFTPQPRTGAKRLFNDRQARALYRHIRNNPTLPFKAIVEWCERTIRQKPCRNTIKNVLRRTGLRHWKSLKRIFLSRSSVLRRVRFYQEWRGREQELTQVYIVKFRCESR
jgi:transposase